MDPTLAARRDRPGHGVWRAALAVAACLLVPSLASAAGPGAYTARRFDVKAQVLGGSGAG